MGFKITADTDCSHDNKTLLGRKAVTNLDSALKGRDITLLTKVHIVDHRSIGPIVKAIAFPIVTYGSESWTIKRDECQRTDVLELWCWRRFLRVP